MHSLLICISHCIAQVLARANILMLDFCMGALICTYAHHFAERPSHLWAICIGGVIAIVPDMIDCLVQPFTTWFYRHEYDPHLLVQHWPLVTIPAALGVIWYYTHDSLWMIIACGALFARYGHHMIGRNGGIRFIAPISMHFFSTNGIEYPHEARRTRYRRSHSRKQSIDTNWMRPSIPCVIELLLAFTCAMIAASRSLSAMPIFLLSIASWAGLAFCTHITRQRDLRAVR